MNLKVFYDSVRPTLFDGSLTGEQVAGLDAVIKGNEKMDLRWLAYALATAHHETGRKFKAIVENLNYSAGGLRATFPKYFSVADAAKYARKPEAIANRAYANRMGNGSEASGDGWKYRGRGLVQITGKDNYTKYGIASNPDAALELDRAVSILIDGMVTGKFTGLKLGDFFNDTKTDWVNARKIINGLDKASKIAEYAQKYHAALVKARGKLVVDLDPPTNACK